MSLRSSFFPLSAMIFFRRFLEIFSIFYRFFCRSSPQKMSPLSNNKESQALRKNRRIARKRGGLKSSLGARYCWANGARAWSADGDGGNRTRRVRKWYWFSMITPRGWDTTGSPAGAKALKFAWGFGNGGNRTRWVRKWYWFSMDFVDFFAQNGWDLSSDSLHGRVLSSDSILCQLFLILLDA